MAPEPNPIEALAAELLEQLSPDELDLYTTYVLSLWLRGDEVGLDVLRRAQGGDVGAAEAWLDVLDDLLELAAELAAELYTTHVLQLWTRNEEVGLHVARRAFNGDESAAETLAIEQLELADELGPDLYRTYLLELADELDEQS